MPDDSVILGQLAEEFTTRVRQGQFPDPEEYAARHPGLADRIRALFPTLMLLEGMAGGATSPVDPVGLSPGAVFGGYRIVREVGRGGMGVVYEATHLALNRRVALKVLPVQAPHAATRLERFLREAQTAASLHHTNIVPVFDVGQVAGTPYYAMQLIEGRGLDHLGNAPDADHTTAEGTAAVAARSQTETLTPTRDHYRLVADVGIQAGEALAYAHRRGVIHRDIKPSNLLLDDQGVVWITDFGLARRLDDVALTHSGVLLGTPRYMSPEQAEAARRPVDHRTDIYSLGATLYEMLTRRPAFDGRTPQEVVGQILEREPVPPSRLDRNVPRDLETVILKAMAKRPEDRYQMAETMADDLRRFLNGEPIRARRIGTVGRTVRWVKRNPVVATLVATIALLLMTGTTVSTLLAVRAQQQMQRAIEAQKAAMWAATQAAENEEKARRALGRNHVEQGLKLAEEGDLFGGLLWLGKALEDAKGREPDEEMQRCRLGAFLRSEKRPALVQCLFADAPMHFCTFSPDGRYVFTASDDRTARVWDVATGEPVSPPFTHRGTVRSAAFSDDGGQVRVVSTDNLPLPWGPKGATFEACAWDVRTGEAVGKPIRQVGNVAAFTPDGSSVLIGTGPVVRIEKGRDGSVMAFTVGEGPGGVGVWNAGTGEPRSVSLRHESGVGHLAFSPDGWRVVTASDDQTARIWDVRTGEPVTGPLRHKKWVDHAAFSVDGRFVATLSADRDVRVWDAATGKEVTDPLSHAKRTDWICFSPDGRRLLTVGDGECCVWQTATGRLLSRLQVPANTTFDAAFSPDARRLVVATLRGAWVCDPETGHPLTPPLLPKDAVYHAEFSPDGSRVVTACADGCTRVWDLSRSVTASSPLPAPRSFWAGISFSADGRHALATQGGIAEGSGRAWLWNLGSGKRVARLGNDRPVLFATFSPSGARVLTLAAGDVGVWESATGRLLATLPVEGNLFGYPAFSPDGERVVTSCGLVIPGERNVETRVWSVATGKAVLDLADPLKAVGNAEFNRAGDRILFGEYRSHVVQLFDAGTGRAVAELEHEGAIETAAFSPDGKQVVTGGADKTVRIWDAATGARRITLPHPDEVTSAAMSPDGSRVTALLPRTHTTRLWDLESRQPVGAPMVHAHGKGPAPLSVVFTPDGKRILTASDESAQLWDAQTQLPVAPLLEGVRVASENVFTPDGKFLGAGGPAPRLYDVSPDDRPVEDLVLLTQLYHGHRLDGSGALVPLTREERRLAWQTLRAKYPNEFSGTREQTRAWHAEEARAGLEAGSLHAAAFHLWQRWMR